MRRYESSRFHLPHDLFNLHSRCQIDQKAKYARWKTADIIKAINEGRTPQSGPPGGEEGQLGSSMFEGNGDGSVSNAEFGFQGVPDVNARNGMAGPDSGAYGHLSPSVGPQGLPGSLPDFPSFPDPPVSRPDSAAGRAAAVPAPAAPRAAAPAPSAFDYSAQKMAGASQGGAYAYDPKVLSNAQKHARFAISAIQYDDIEAAVDNLKRALKYLEPYQRA